MSLPRRPGIRRPFCLMGMALFLALWATGFSGTGQLLARKDAASATTTLPPDLERVPRDAAVMISYRVADLWSNPLAQELRKQLHKEATELQKNLTLEFGLPPDKVERATFVMLETKAYSMDLALVRTLTPFDRKRLLAATGTSSSTKTFEKDIKLHLNEDDSWAVHILDERHYLMGAPSEMITFLTRPRKKDGPLVRALDLAAHKHDVVVGVNGVDLERLVALDRRIPKELAPLSAITKLRYGTLVCDLTDDLRVQMTLNFSKPPQRAPGKRAGALVRLTLEVEADLPALVTPLVGGIRAARQAAQRNTTMNHFKQLGLAFHTFHDQNKHFPPAAIYDKNGKPLLSWRVLLLPYLEEEQERLFEQFHLDEPWDSAHNKKLLTKMPKVFAPAGAKPARPGETCIQGLVGKDAFLDPAKKKGVTLGDITDGLSNTIILVEGATPVPWTKPEDLPFDAAKPLPKIGGHFPGGFLALFADGHVSFLSDRINPVILKRLITRNEGISPHQGIPPEKQVDY